jgi:hypothetical protein
MKKVETNYKINPKTYILNLLKYCSITFNEIIPILFSYYIFNINQAQEQIKVVGMVYSSFMLFNGFAYDFFEPINTLCLPFLEKNNIKLYSLKVWKVGFFNFLFYLTGFTLFSIFRIVISQFDIKGYDFFLMSLGKTTKFMLMPGLAYTINNFFKGKSLLRIGYKHFNGKYFPVYVHICLGHNYNGHIYF